MQLQLFAVLLASNQPYFACSTYLQTQIISNPIDYLSCDLSTAKQAVLTIHSNKYPKSKQLLSPTICRKAKKKYFDYFCDFYFHQRFHRDAVVGYFESSITLKHLTLCLFNPLRHRTFQEPMVISSEQFLSYKNLSFMDENNNFKFKILVNSSNDSQAKIEGINNTGTALTQSQVIK